MTAAGPQSGDDSTPAERAPVQAPLTFSTAGFVTGLALEQRLLRRAQKRHAVRAAEPPTILCAGADSRRAGDCAAHLLQAGTGWLVSFGVAGGLDPDLEPGTLLLPEVIMSERGREVRTDDARRGPLLGRALEAGLSISEGPLYGSSEPIGSATGKIALHRALGCVAVDMESHAVAAVAAKARRPLLVIRAVADPASRSLPPYLSGTIDAKGRSRLSPVLRRLIKDPGLLGPLLQLRKDLNQATATRERLLAVGDDLLFGGGL